MSMSSFTILYWENSLGIRKPNTVSQFVVLSHTLINYFGTKKCKTLTLKKKLKHLSGNVIFIKPATGKLYVWKTTYTRCIFKISNK